jgi:hypothetical protein
MGMSMQSGTGWRAAGASGRNICRHHLRVLAASLIASLVAGCNHDSGPMASAEGPSGATVAFESIDGPPMGIFNRLVQNLNEEAQTRQLAVVSREGPANYRVRGYLAAHIESKQTVIAWVWDVYDAGQRRTLRITGEEKAAGTRSVRDGWSAADDRVLRRIAQASLDDLVRHLGAPDTSGGATAIAFGDDTPESAGIFRSSKPEEERAGESAPRSPSQAALPGGSGAMAFTIE